MRQKNGFSRLRFTSFLEVEWFITKRRNKHTRADLKCVRSWFSKMDRGGALGRGHLLITFLRATYFMSKRIN